MVARVKGQRQRPKVETYLDEPELIPAAGVVLTPRGVKRVGSQDRGPEWPRWLGALFTQGWGDASLSTGACGRCLQPAGTLGSWSPHPLCRAAGALASVQPSPSLHPPSCPLSLSYFPPPSLLSLIFIIFPEISVLLCCPDWL